MAIVKSNEFKPLRNVREFDDQGTRLLYIIARATITETEYNNIVAYLGTNGPGYQALNINKEYFLACDGDPTKVKAEVLVRLAEKMPTEEEPEEDEEPETPEDPEEPETPEDPEDPEEGD